MSSKIKFISMNISVIYIHHVGAFGGASRSLLELLRAPSGAVIKPYVISQKGQVSTILNEEGVPVVTTSGIAQFDNTLFGYYRGLRWLIIFREIAYLFPTIIALRAAKKKWGDVDIIHVNELTAIPVAVIAKWIFKSPLIVHVRSVQRAMTSGLRGKLLRYLIHRYVDQLVAIDCTVRASLPEDFSVEIVHNGFPLPDERQRKSHERSNLNFSSARPLRVGCVGSLLKSKGVYELVEAAELCTRDGLAVEFFLVGENPRILRGIRGYILKRFGFAADVRADLNALIGKYGLDERVKIKGFTADVKAFYDSIDVLCFPSHLDACGRPVFEAAFSRVPSIVAVDKPFEDTIIDGQTGICIPAKNPIAIVDAIRFFYSRPDELKRMGEAAYKLAAKNFDINVNAKIMVNIYQNLICKSIF